MENQRQKWVNLVFTGVAILVAAIVFVGLSKISAVYNFESSFKQIDLAIRFGSITFGVIAGLALYLNQQSNAFMNEVVLEMSRVTWPSQKDTKNATIWVILFVIVAGALLGVCDSIMSWLMKSIL